MFKLLDSIRKNEADARRQNFERYRTLLCKGDSASHEEGLEIIALAEKLNKSGDDVEADLRAVTSLRRLEELTATEPAREKVYRQKHIAHQELANRTEQAIKELHSKLAISENDKYGAERSFHEARRAQNPLTELRRTHWELFGLNPPDGPSPMRIM